VKLIRTIRLDPSDTFVFERAAEPGEWAISGAFMFAAAEPDAMDGRARAAFRSGFLGVPSLGWSTLVQIVAASEQERAALVETVAQALCDHLGAPDRASALAAAEEEVAFAASLCDQPADTLIAVRRTFEDSEIREAFRTLRPRGARQPMRAFSFLEVQGEEEQKAEQGEGEAAENVNLVTLAQEKPRGET
jgi:hypothetical protein